jgi:predicted SPOUT superfamily RNA methylase MTH1
VYVRKDGLVSTSLMYEYTKVPEYVLKTIYRIVNSHGLAACLVRLKHQSFLCLLGIIINLFASLHCR